MGLGILLLPAAEAGLLDTLMEWSELAEVGSDGGEPAKISPVDVKQLYQRKQQAADAEKRSYALNDDDKYLIANTRWRYFMAHSSVFDSDVFVLEAGAVDKPAMILIHGLGQNGLRDWLNVIPQFEKQYHIIALDLPGFGLSEVAEGQYSPTHFAMVVQQVAAAFAVDNYVVVGHSMGGAVALRYASMYGSQMQQLVLVDAAGILERTAFLKHAVEFPVDVYGLPDFSVKLITGVEELGQSLIETVTGLPDAVEHIRKFKKFWNRTLGLNPNMNAATALIYEDFSAAAHETRVPTTIIWGGDDGVAPLRTGVMLNETLDKSRLHTIAECGHTPMRERPDAFNELLAAALKSPPTEDDPSTPNLRPGTEKLVIKGQTNRVYSGEYSEVEIVDSTAIHLKNLSAKRLSVTDASVRMENVYLASETTAMIAMHSVVDGTNVTLAANNGILADDSRIDLANATLLVDDEAVNIGADSQLIFSASRIESPAYSGYVHGQYRSANTTLKLTKNAND